MPILIMTFTSYLLVYISKMIRFKGDENKKMNPLVKFDLVVRWGMVVMIFEKTVMHISMLMFL